MSDEWSGARPGRGVRRDGGRAAAGRGLVPVGSVRQRAPVGHRPRGLQRRRRRLVVPAPRPRPIAGLPLGRGRHGRVLRRRAAAVPRAGAVERSDPILKERMFGLTGAEANHGEDVKEYWWYLDAVPSHAWNRWRYHYPQAAFPYEDLIAENGRRGKFDPEYELLDTGVFDDDRYWIVEVDYVKADPTDVLMTVRVDERGTGHGRRCTSCRRCGSATPGRGTSTPRRRSCGGRADGAIAIDHPLLGDLELLRRHGDRRHRADGAVLRERDQRRRGCSVDRRRRRTRRTGSTTTSSTARRPSTLPARGRRRRSGTGWRFRRA